MRDTSRRQFLRASAAVVPLVGAGTSVGATNRRLAQTRTLQQQGVPGYADWIPADDIILDENDEVTVGSFDVRAMLETFAADDEGGDESDEPTPLPIEGFFFNVLAAAFGWGSLDEVGLSEPIIGQESRAATENPSLDGVPADRQTSVGDTSVYTGSFDTDEFETIVEDEAFAETDSPGVYRFETFFGEEFVTWEEGYVAVSSTLEELQAVVAAGTGDAASRHRESTDLEQLLASGGQGDFVFARFTEAESLTFDQEGEDDFFQLDYSPLEGVQGYAHSNWVDIEAEQLDAVTVAGFASEDGIDMDRLGQIGADATQQDISRNGRFVTIETRYEGEALTGTPDDDTSGDDNTTDDASDDDTGDDDTSSDDTTDDDTDGDDNTTDGETGDDDTSDDDAGDEEMDGNDTSGDDTGGDDADGAGFGVIAALSSIGGAGYMLSRRLGPSDE